MGSKPEIIFYGSGVSPGVVFGQALKIDSHNRLILKIHVDDAEAEVQRFLKAIEASKEQLEALKTRLEEKMGSEHSVIFDAHLLILEDRTLHAEILAGIRGAHANAEWAVIQATDRIVHAYESLEDEYFRERHSDIEHVVERILLNLTGDRPLNWEHLPDDLIIVSRDFNPSNFATMDLQKVRGLVLESGGRTSHTAIICRGLRLPAVMGIRNILASISTGEALLLNGDEGQVVAHPAQERIESAHRESARRHGDAFDTKAEPAPIQSVGAALTRNGTSVSLYANTELPHELAAAKASGAEGIGLYRSEFLFFSHPRGFPEMEEQLSVYRMLAREMNPYPVAVRTLDAGSERLYDSLDPAGQANPSMGLRGIRLSLRIKDAFRAQIEAILRAGCEGRIEMVLPMISTVEEIRQAKALIAQVRSDLLEKPGLILNAVPLGIMIEVPAAVLSLEALAAESDFLCVGTNDLIQYMMAVDRGNPHVAYLFQPLHPSVLRCLSLISETAGKMNKPVRICGEISSNPFFAVLLLGMGFTQLSMNPLSIPAIRRVLHEVPIEASRQIARRALAFVTAQDVHQYLVDAVSKLISWDLSAYENEIAAPNGRANK
jgi:phosphoenolpyruvate-protein phosphotransferase (PTS system enzyme I)